MLKFRVKYILGGKKFYRDVAAVDDFEARVKVLLRRGYRENHDPHLKPDFKIVGVQELPIDYPIEEDYNAS